MPNFPNVPKLPGVPSVPRSPNFPTTAAPVIQITSLVSQLWDTISHRATWGVFRDAGGGDLRPVIIPDNITSFGNTNEYSVVNFPIQEGKFASFNKIANPFDASVSMTVGGGEQTRAAFLKQLDFAISTLDKYIILTPEKSYTGVNLVRYRILRSGAKDAYFFSDVELFFVEIREVQSQYVTTQQAATQTVNAQSPGATPEQLLGNVKTTSVSVPVGARALAALDAVPL